MINLIFAGRFPQKARLVKFGDDVINHFFKRDRKDIICVGIEMKSKLEFNDAGFCVDYGSFACGQFGSKKGAGKRSRMISISLARNYFDAEEEYPENFPYTVKEIASTLAHELVHVKQYIRRELTVKALTNALYTSAGKRKTLSPNQYRNLPWEEEAFRLEEELLELYW